MFAVCYLAAIAFTVILILAFGRKRQVAALCMGAVLFGIVGFMMTPNPAEYVDTVRFFNTLDEARSFAITSYDDAWNYLMVDNGYNATPVIGIILFLITLQQENGWLTFIAAFVDVGAGFYLVYQQTNKGKNKNALIIGILCFLCLFNFNAGVSGVRNYMAGFAAICVAYTFSRRFSALSLLLYIPLILIHPFAMIIPVLYLLSVTYRRHKLLYTLLCIPLLCQHYIQDLIFSIFKHFSNIPFFSSLLFKSTQYFGDEAYIIIDSSFSRMRSIFLLFLYLSLLIMAMHLRHNINVQYIGFTVMFACFAIGAFQDEQLFSRCVSMLMIAILPFICELIKEALSQSWARMGPTFPFVIVLVCSTIILVDNLRAGVRFQIMDISVYAICVICIYLLSVIYLLIVCNDGLCNVKHVPYIKGKL